MATDMATVTVTVTQGHTDIIMVLRRDGIMGARLAGAVWDARPAFGNRDAADRDELQDSASLDKARAKRPHPNR